MTPPPAVIAASWRPAEIRIHAPLARLLLADRPMQRLPRQRRKIARTLFHLVHQRLGLRAAATLRLADGTAIAVNCADTGFLHYALRSGRPGGLEPEVSGLFIGLAERLRVVYDIGANWGYYPLLLGSEPRFRGVIHAFEISPRVAGDLHALVVRAGLTDRVSVHDFGLSDRDGDASVSRGRHSYLSRVVGEGYRGAIDRVAVRRLDGLSLPPPDLIKIDVEGHEAAVLRGAAAILARHKPLIVIESWHRPESPDAMLEPLRLLDELGYRFHRLRWQQAPAGAVDSGVRRGTVVLEPLAIADRPAIPAALNLLAVPATRASGLAQ